MPCASDLLVGEARSHVGVRQVPGRHLPADAGAPTQVSNSEISMLQEFVQCSKHFSLPPKYRVLHWDFETREVNSSTLEFRAVVAFLLEGIPHHALGGWCASKQLAKRDAAKCALGLFVGCWGEQLLLASGVAGPCDSLVEPSHACCCESLEVFCRDADVCEGETPRYDVRRVDAEAEGGLVSWTAIVELRLLGVPHKLSGAACSDEASARADAARRVLWYLQAPGYKDDFEPDPGSPLVTAPKIPLPPVGWMPGEDAEESALAAAARKTAIMSVQNRLQQVYRRQLRTGESVWGWDYEGGSGRSNVDGGWLPLYRASVFVPVIGRKFEGDWSRGQREAQISAVGYLSAFLDETEADPLNM